MKLDHPFIQLPLSFDADMLAREVAALGESVWRPHPQGFAGNSMLPLVAVDGDGGNESFDGAMAPTAELRDCPYLMQVFAALGATVGRSRLMRLSGQAEVTRHVDQGYYWAERVRVHVPIVTQPTVRFECGGVTINMAAGECWIFDTWRQHRVVNDAVEERIHLVVDTVGGGRFWDLVAAGRPHAAAAPGWGPAPVAPSAERREFPCERQNVPVVMSPWEIGDLLGLLFAAAPQQHPALPTLRTASQRFLKSWQGLWFEHGPDPARRGAYQPALKAFIDASRAPGQALVLANEITWFSGMMTLIARYAAGDLRAGAGRPMA